ncbi:unnamed protein product [Litomosoides sigmodontis]|uniref:Uncharacterized protein n=1 Tax=Litomosoides sigmodontis TaxID=42156 RepID=A0A3P6TTW9_LITSI|nr:unnamed protein product [Litomosoides sigmodontis]
MEFLRRTFVAVGRGDGGADATVADNATTTTKQENVQAPCVAVRNYRSANISRAINIRGISQFHTFQSHPHLSQIDNERYV